jgi:hypothetical protein
MRSLCGFLRDKSTKDSFEEQRPGRDPCDAPVCVQHSRSVASEEGYLVGGFPALVQGDDSKSTATARFPIDGNILGVDLMCSPTVSCQFDM